MRGLLVAGLLAAALAPPAHAARTVAVHDPQGFARAAARLVHSGGTIVLRPGAYGSLVLRSRGRGRLHVVGRGGVRVGRFLLLGGARHVSISHLRIGPVGGDAVLELAGASDVDIDDVSVSAAGSRFRAGIFVRSAWHVRIADSVFTQCGDRSAEFSNCITLNRGAHAVVIERNRFHDCHGCDFVHGRFGSRLTIRGNRFDRALPCHGMGRYRCGHNDLVQLFAGQWLRVERNRFGVYRSGGAQLYLTDDVDHARIVNNLFFGTDPKLPGYRARMAIVIGANESKRLPYDAVVANNTILTGYRRKDGYAGSVRISSKYGGVRLWKRPVFANNVIALLDAGAWRVCHASQRFLANIVLQGRSCTAGSVVGADDLDPAGRPHWDSNAIGIANRHYAPATDFTGRPRDAEPDAGAYEWRR